MDLPANPDASLPWAEIRAELRRVVGESTYDIWLASLEVTAWDGTLLLLQAPPATRTWVAKRYAHVLEACVRAVVGSAIKVTIAGSQGAAAPAEAADPDVPRALNPRYIFDQFIIGEGNRLAHGAALAVAELPGQAYNPLFLHAPPGLGKTHLLHAIGNYVLAYGGGATVRYTTVEAFTNEFISALGSRSVGRFKRAYRDVDVLLIDDVQFLASKAKTEEEFFHTFNALYETGRQLVLTCDRVPRELAGVEKRLRERFDAGLVANIDAPDFNTRVAILRKRAALDGVVLEDPAVLELIAERVTDNVRALEGALIRVVAYHSLSSRPIDLELARTVLDTMYPESRPRPVSIEGIQSAVAAHYDLSATELVSDARAVRVAWPRQVAIYLARELTGASLQTIGDAFRRNHATVMHACKRVSERVSVDADADREVSVLRASVRER